MIYDRITRILHAGIAIAVSLQLISEQMMRAPEPGKVPPNLVEALFFAVHEFIGFAILTLVVLRFVFLMDDKEGGWAKLFPWIETAGRLALFNEIRQDIPGWIKGKLKRPDDANCLARSVHGLGLLLALGLGLTGSMIYAGMEPDGGMSPPLRFIRECHGIMGTMMWVYLIGHVCMVFAHQLLGHRILQNMFRLGAD